MWVMTPCQCCVVDDTLEGILGGSDDEAEEDAVISQVLDEIGIEVSSKVNFLITTSECPNTAKISEDYNNKIWSNISSGVLYTQAHFKLWSVPNIHMVKKNLLSQYISISTCLALAVVWSGCGQQASGGEFQGWCCHWGPWSKTKTTSQLGSH